MLTSTFFSWLPLPWVCYLALTMVLRTLTIGPVVFLCFLPVIRPPSDSWSTGSSGYSSPLGFPTFTMGSPLRGRGSFILDCNKGLVSPFGSGTLVSSWLDLTPLYAAFLRALSLRVCCQVVLAVSMAFVCPWLSPVFFPVPC